MSGRTWAAFPVLQRWDVEPLAADTQLVAPFADGAPAIVARRLGRGRVVAMTTPLSDPLGGDRRPWNLLPTGEDPWPFLLLAPSLVDHLTAGPTAPTAYVAGATASVPLPAGGDAAGYVLRLPGGDAVRQTPAPGADTLAVRLTDEPGAYRVEGVGAAGRIDRRFVVNLTEGVGRLDRVDPAELVETLGADRVEIVRDRQALARSIDRGRVGAELYGWALALMTVATVGEHLVSNRFYRRVGDDPA